MGAPTASGAIHARMNEKRIRKLNPLKTRRDLFDVYGDPKAAIGVIAGAASPAWRARR